MTQITIEVKGLQQVRDRLAKLGQMLKSHEIDRQWAQRVRDKLKSKPYPPKLPNQIYQRTGQLANSWSAGTGNGFIWERNSSGHGPFVVGDKQAAIHEGRWWKASEVIEGEIPELLNTYAKTAESIWG